MRAMLRSPSSRQVRSWAVAQTTRHLCGRVYGDNRSQLCLQQIRQHKTESSVRSPGCAHPCSKAGRAALFSAPLISVFSSSLWHLNGA